MSKVITFSESYRRSSYRASASKELAEIVDFTEAGPRIYRRRRFDDYSVCYVQMEVECAKLMNDQRRGFPHSANPSIQASADFQIETASVLRFEMNVSADSESVMLLRKITTVHTKLRAVLGGLLLIPQRYTREMGDIFTQVEIGLGRTRSQLSLLCTPLGVTLPPPAYL